MTGGVANVGGLSPQKDHSAGALASLPLCTLSVNGHGNTNAVKSSTTGAPGGGVSAQEHGDVSMASGSKCRCAPTPANARVWHGGTDRKLTLQPHPVSLPSE